MHRLLWILLLPAVAFAQPPATVQTLGWLEGCWQYSADDQHYQEIWLPPSDNLLLGVSQRVRAGATEAFEYVRVADDGGTLTYFAQPQGGSAVAFRGVGITDERAIFVRHESGDPQRITYRRLGPDQLQTQLDAPDGAGRSPLVFLLTRKDC